MGTAPPPAHNRSCRPIAPASTIDRVSRRVHHVVVISVLQELRCYNGVMMIASPSLCQLTDTELLTCLRRAVAHERQATAGVIALLMELDVRRLYLAEGCSSLFNLAPLDTCLYHICL